MSDLQGSWLERELESHGVSRREFLQFCAAMTSVLALPDSLAAAVAQAVERTPKPILVWLEFQDCAGNTESFLRASRPTAAEIVLDTLSVDYHETIMAAAGHQAEAALTKTVAEKSGGYIAVVEGSIPTAAGGAYCTIGGRAAIDIAREVCGKAAATIAIGTCAAFGGLPAASPNPTGALGVADAVPGLKNLINLPACPANVENLTALVVYYLAFKRLPPLDAYHRPLFAYGKAIHDNCERRAHFDAGEYVQQWGDAGAKNNFCLYKMGCKGPMTYNNCSIIRYNEGTNWPIGAGHGCIGCSELGFWDRYAHERPLASADIHAAGPFGLGIESSVDKFGVGLLAATGVGIALHAVLSATAGRHDRPGDADLTGGE